MTDFQKLLEYQSLNIELRKLDREYETLADKKKFDIKKDKLAELQSKVVNGAAEAQSLIDEIQTAYANYKMLMDQYNLLDAAIEKAENDEEKVKLFSQFESIKTRLENINRNISHKTQRSKELVSQCARAMESRKTVREECDNLKKNLDKFKEDKLSGRKNLEEQMSKLEPEIDKDLFAQYIAVRSEGILPVLVKAGIDGKNYSCFCGISLSQAKKGELDEKKLCRCENCRRMIYIK